MIMDKTHQLKTAVLAVVMLASASGAATATEYASYFTMGVNDTVTVPRSALGSSITVPVRAHFGNPANQWDITLTYPDGLQPIAAEASPSMTISYTGSQGQDCVVEVPLASTSDLTLFTASTTVYGYFLYSGSYMQYGLVKWELADYDEMFSIIFFLADDFPGGTVTMQGTVTSGYDRRYWTSGSSNMFFKAVVFAVESLIGDVNSDGQVNITDVTVLTNLLLGSTAEISATDLPAADIDGNGTINITDVTQLINIVMHQ